MLPSHTKSVVKVQVPTTLAMGFLFLFEWRSRILRSPSSVIAPSIVA
jgi:hypothetical protein